MAVTKNSQVNSLGEVSDSGGTGEGGSKSSRYRGHRLFGTSRAAKWFGRYLLPAGWILGTILLWQLIASVAGLQSYILPKPTSVFMTAVSGDVGQLMTNARTTFTEILTGYAAAIVAGITISSALVLWSTLKRAVYPVIIMTQTVPTLAIAPVLVIWFGFGILPKVLVVAIFGFFPIVVNFVSGMESVEQDAKFLLHMLGARRWAVFWRLRVPSGLPSFFVGAKLAAVYAPIGAITGEWVGANSGLGPLMINSNADLNTTLVFASILYLAVMALLLFSLVSVVEKLSMKWYFLLRRGEIGKAS